MNLYRLFDVKAAIYHRPFPEVNDDTARRVFLAAVCDDANPAYHHPHDFSLWHVGSYTDDSPTLVPEVPEAMIASGQEVAMERDKLMKERE